MDASWSIELLIAFMLILRLLLSRLSRPTHAVRDLFTIKFDLFYDIEFQRRRTPYQFNLNSLVKMNLVFT